MQKLLGRAGLKAWKSRGIEGRGQLFKTYDDMITHMIDRCSNNGENPYINTSGEGVITRRTIYGFLIPCGDMFTRKGKIMCCKLPQNGYFYCVDLEETYMDCIKLIGALPRNDVIRPDIKTYVRGVPGHVKFIER